ncbi:MAG TPA: hypothetical protein VKG84_09890, partial [Candidatus Acidoferrales bacterium]|nr:hypothetical protein [Candidatus Acidoferrales bacterium]
MKQAPTATALLLLTALSSLLLFAGPQITAGQDAAPKPVPATLHGYSAAGSQAELALEKKFAAIPSPARARE